MTVKYSKDHEWIPHGTGNVGTIGITDHAQEQLGDGRPMSSCPEAGARAQGRR